MLYITVEQMYNSVLHCFTLVNMSGMLPMYNMCNETFYIAIVEHHVYHCYAIIVEH